jgi:hypothetical protein
MKLKTITAILKANKKLYTYTKGLVLEDDENEAESITERWISNGAAIYKLDERIALTTSMQWLVLLDVPSDKHKDWDYRDQILPRNICFDDTDEHEEDMFILPFTLGWRDKIFRFFKFGNGIITANEEYLKPFWGVDEEYVTFTGRRDTSGNIYIAVKTGLMLQAIIAPYKLEKTMSDDIDNGQGELIADICTVGRGLLGQATEWQLKNEAKKGD